MIPVQVDIEEVQSLVAEPVESTTLAKALRDKYRAYNFQIVRAINDEGNSGDMIQFLVPQRFESSFPCQCVVNDVTFAIDHALPYSPPLSVPSRPPTEETRHDHWNKAACLKQTRKKGRHNQIAAKKGCPGSINRAHCLQEGIIQGKCGKINTSFEFHHFPLLFVAGAVTADTALEHLIACMPGSYLKEHIESAVTKLDDPRVPAVEHRSEVPVLYILEVEGDGAQCLNVGCVIKVNERLTISNAEILQCHTFTKCMLCTVVPPGFTIDDLCTPPESYQVHSFHSLGIVANKKDLSNTSQAYSGGSAVGPTLTEAKSNMVGNTNSTPISAARHMQRGEGTCDEQVSATLPWTSRSSERVLTPEHNGQQPIIPTKKKGLVSIKPSCKERAGTCIQKTTPVVDDQDVEMADANDGQRVDQASQIGKPAPSRDDPIESYGLGNEDMEIDSEGNSSHHAKGKQAKPAQGVVKKKPSREVIASIASPQKSDCSKNNQECPEKQPLAPPKNNSKASRPPGITVFQHASILPKDRERKENQTTRGQEPRQVSRSGKRQARNGHHISKGKGVTNTSVNLLLQKAINTPIQSQLKDLDELEQESQKGEVIDLEQEDLARALAAENVMKQSIHEANMKWHANEDEESRITAGRYALEFLKSMNGTLCYLMVAFRMLAKAPWTANMVCVHVRQAAIYAISKGWFVNTSNSHGIQFSRAELALAAGTFLGDLRPNLPDDPDQPMFLLIHGLPDTCAGLFSSGTAVCKSCGQTKIVPVPTFASAISWSSPTWGNLKQCIEHNCAPFPWISDPDDATWHEKDCTRHDTDVIDIQIGPWAYVSLRGSELEHFPDFSTVTEILQDTSLESQGFVIQAFVCCNIHEVQARRFWLLEVQNGKPVWLFDSLGGLTPSTLEVTKKPWITGFLLVKRRTDCPVLTSKSLEEERLSVPIAVQSRTTWLRKTQQQITKTAAKGKKSSTKKGLGGQKPLVKFFTKAEGSNRTRSAAKVKSISTPKKQEFAVACPVEPPKGEPSFGGHLECPAPTQAQDGVDKNQWGEEVDANDGQANYQIGNSHTGTLLNAYPGEASPGGNQSVPRRIGVNADYGVISLFDGVSTVVPTLQKKLGYPPTVIVLAEIDVSLRALVCAEFGYRPDQTWGRTKHGSVSLYVKDVNTLLKDNCRCLYEAVSIAPNAKWIIVGGSPCQDLTFAGPFRGLLGLVGKNSRLFFVLLGVIRAMQDLATTNNVRFLVENAGSMGDIHYQAFCTLLGTPSEPRSEYVWDPADYGYGITRKRNFFRAHTDRQFIQESRRLCPKQGGPLMAQDGRPITLPPLLRTRDLLPFEVCWSSWTLYQPSALIWDYEFWGGPDTFSKKVALAHGKVPQVYWEEIILPPFQIPWKQFLSLLQGPGGGSKSFDEIIKQLIPMFNGSQIRLPVRILDELEVLKLSGLEEQWSNTRINDAERLPERVIRDYCGNSFHPELIGSALGEDQVLKQWVEGVIIGRGREEQGLKLGTLLIKDLPYYPDPCDPQRRLAVPRIHDVTIHGPRTPKQTKQERYQFCCNQAAVHHLGVPLSQLLRSSGLEVCFDAFRAPVTATFQFEDYIRFLFGCQVSQLAAYNAGQGPSLNAANQIQAAFQRLEHKRTRIALLDCLLAAGCYNGESRWPVGHFVAFREGAQQGIYYLGSEKPKLILLIIEDQYGQPGMWMIGATAYRVPLEGGQEVSRVIESSKVRAFPDAEYHAWIECQGGALLLNTPLHCSRQSVCPACFLAQINEFEYCPMHCSERFDPDHLTHFVCCQDDNVAWLV